MFAPFVINIDNISAGAGATIVNDVVLFDISNAFPNSSPSYQSPANPNIVISMGYAGATYREMLATTSAMPFIVGLTLLQGINIGLLDNAQIQTTTDIKLTEHLASGKGSGTPLLFYPDIYQPQDNILACRSSYKIDTFFKAVIGTIYPSTRCQLRFYPSNNTVLMK